MSYTRSSLQITCLLLSISGSAVAQSLPQAAARFPTGANPVFFEARTEKTFTQNEPGESQFGLGAGRVRIRDGAWDFVARDGFPFGNTTLFYSPTFNPFIDTVSADPARLLRVADNFPLPGDEQFFTQNAVQPYLQRFDVDSNFDFNPSRFLSGALGSILWTRSGRKPNLGWRDNSARFSWIGSPEPSRIYTFADYEILGDYTSESRMNSEFPGGTFTFEFPAAYQLNPILNQFKIDIFPDNPKVFGGNWVDGAYEFDVGFFTSIDFGVEAPGQPGVTSFLRQFTGTTSAVGLGSQSDTQSGGDSLRVVIFSPTDGARFFPNGVAETISVVASDFGEPLADSPDQPPRSVTLGDALGNLVVSTTFPGGDGFLSVGEDPTADSNPETDNYLTLGVGNDTLDSRADGNESMTFTARSALVPQTITFSFFRGNDRCIIEGVDAETGELLADIIDVEDTQIIDAPVPAELNQFNFNASDVFAGRPLESLTIKAQSSTGNGQARFGFFALEYQESLDFGVAIGSAYETRFTLIPNELREGSIEDGVRAIDLGEELTMRMNFTRERSSASNLFGSTATSVNRLDVNIRPIEGFRSFSALNFGFGPGGSFGFMGGPEDDFDGDGRSNLREFVAGTNPRLDDADPPDFITQEFFDDGRISFRVLKPARFGAAVNYIPEVSSDMIDYTEITADNEDWVITEEGGVFIVTSVNPIEDAVFMRFRFELNF